MAGRKAKKQEATNTFSIKTNLLKEMVGKSIKGASINKLLPITQMMAIKLQGGVLELITTDATNYLYVRESKVEGEDFYACVSADQFSKLISRMTCDSINLELTDAALKVRGNGEYLVPLQFDEDGTIVNYPDPLKDFEAEGEARQIQGTTVNTILNAVKPSLATTLENPCYIGYYAGDKVVGTDSFQISVLDVQLFDEPKLIAPEVMELVGILQSEKINVDCKDNVTVFSTPNCVVYSQNMDGIEDFAIKDILEYTETEFPSMCKLNKSVLLQLLDRLSLFVADFDRNAIHLTFTKDGMQVSSVSSSGVELIPYVESSDFADFTCAIELPMFIRQIKAHASDAIELWYGEDSAIKLVDGNVLQIVGLLDDEAE